jgi:hypothetical protein
VTARHACHLLAPNAIPRGGWILSDAAYKHPPHLDLQLSNPADVSRRILSGPAYKLSLLFQPRLDKAHRRKAVDIFRSNLQRPTKIEWRFQIPPP